MSLPRTEEHLIRDYVKFRVGKIVYASISPDETTLGFGFPKEERAALIDSQPDRFLWPKLSDQRFHWINARMAALEGAHHDIGVAFPVIRRGARRHQAHRSSGSRGRESVQLLHVL